MVSPSGLATLLLLTLTALLVIGLPWAVARGGRRLGLPPARVRRNALIVAAGVLAWLAVTGGVAGQGLLLDFQALPPPMFRVVLPGVVLTAVLAFSAPGRLLAHGSGWGLLIGFQAYRIPVEFMLADLYADGVLPVQMTYHGRNFDILTGITAIGVAWLAARGTIRRAGILVWNVLGLGLLVNIVSVAVLSTPGRLQVFTEGPPNTIVFHWPFVWLPTIIVLAALLGHLLVFRKLWAERVEAAQAPGRSGLA